MLQELQTSGIIPNAIPMAGFSELPKVDDKADQDYLLAVAAANRQMAEDDLRDKDFISARDHAALSEEIMSYLVGLNQSKTSMQAGLAKTQTLLLKSLVKKRAYRDAGNVQLRLNKTVKMLG